MNDLKKNLAEWLRNALTFETKWSYEGEGHWAPPRRRVRPVIKVSLGLAAAGLAAVLGMRFYPGEAPEPAPDAPEAVVQEKQDAVTGPRIIAVAPLSSVPEGPLEAPSAGDEAAGEKILSFVPGDVDLDDLDPVVEGGGPSEPDASGAGGGGQMPAKEPLRIGPNPRPGKAVPYWQRDYWIRISKGDYTLSLYRGQEVVKEYSIAVGKNPGNKQYIGDHRTPEGDFRVVSIEDASKWKHDFGDGKGKIAGAYGPWFIRLDAGGWKGIGIHGTHDPDSRGTMATEGCIRLSNEELRELRRYAYRSMRVVIEE